MDHSQRKERARGADDPPDSVARNTVAEIEVDLLERLRRNDREAMAQLYDRYGRLAFGLAYRVLRKAPEAEDVVQEAFLAIWRQADRLDAARGVKSYLLTVVHHKAVDSLRRRKGLPELGLELAAKVPAAAADPAEAASQSAARYAVRAALRALPAEQRQAVEMAYFGGLTANEVAERTNVPVGTVKSRLRLALGKMRERLAGAI